MNALRTFAIADSDGKLIIQVPEEYRQKQVEVIVLPVDEYGIPKDKYYFENLAKIQNPKDVELREVMDEMARQVAENRLTPEILEGILNQME